MKQQAHVLVISQDAEVGRDLERTLTELGFETSHIRSLNEPGFDAEGADFDAIIADIGTADGDGIAFAKQLCADHPWSPLIVVSDPGDAGTAARLEAVGAVGYLAKPVGAESLQPAMLQALRSRVELLNEEMALADESVHAPFRPEEDVKGGRRLLRTLTNMALFLISPFIALSYMLALPFVGLYVLARRFLGGGRGEPSAPGENGGTTA